MSRGETGSRAALSVESLTFARDGSRVLHAVSLALEAGRVLAVLGPSGAGKSTLLSLIAGFERPESGRILLDGRDAAPLAPAERGVAIAFDDGALHETLDVTENLVSAAAALGEPRRERLARVRALAGALGIEHLLARRPASLSAGERRRVAIARVFARRPKVALLDEPFANLDRANRLEVRRLVRALRDTTGAATVVVTHDPTDALAIADDLLVLVDGRVRAHGPALEVWSRPPDPEVAQLVDDLGMTIIDPAASRDGREEPTRASIRLAPPLRRRITPDSGATAAHGTVLGVRPAHWRTTAQLAGRAPALSIEVEIEGLEPGGLATDLVGTVEGSPVRARLDARAAQELPKSGRVTLHAHEEDIHLFALEPRRHDFP
ncbi:MAG: hypothetical protein RI967_1304 [Planctomycetota bacterium]